MKHTTTTKDIFHLPKEGRPVPRKAPAYPSSPNAGATAAAGTGGAQDNRQLHDMGGKAAKRQVAGVDSV